MDKFSEFYQKVSADEKATRKFMDIVKDKDFSKLTESDFEKLVPLAETLGFDITAKEAYDHFCGDISELDEEQLDMVAGGKNDVYKHYDGDAYI